MAKLNFYSKVFYRPIEAAIRWSRLTSFESQILKRMCGKVVPSPSVFPEWPALHLNTELILDAMRHGELPYGKAGMTINDPKLLADPSLTVRHVDLRTWMLKNYPDQRPEFLFDRRRTDLSMEPYKTLLVEINELRTKLEESQSKLSKLEAASNNNYRSSCSISDRAEKTYLHIIGGMLTLLLGGTPSGRQYSIFRTQEAIIDAMIAHHQGVLGITERTLQAKFAAAKRFITKL